MKQEDFELEAGKIIGALEESGIQHDDQLVVLSQALGERLGARMDNSGSILSVLNVAMNHAFHVACLTAGQLSEARRIGRH